MNQNKIDTAKWDLMERIAKGECFLDALDDVVKEYQLDDSEKKAVAEFVIN